MKKSFTLFVLVFLAFVSAHAKNTVGAKAQNKDSLYAVWNNPQQADTSRLKAIYVFLWEIQSAAPDSAEKGARNMLAFAQKIEPDQKTASLLYQGYALGVIGNCYYIRGDLRTAIVYFKESMDMQILQKDTNSIASSMANMGTIYSNLGEIDSSKYYYEQSMKLFTAIGRESGMGMMCNNLGQLAKNEGDLAGATKYFLEGIKHNEKVDNKLYLIPLYGNLGDIMQQQGDFEKATEYTQRALVIAEEFDDQMTRSMLLSSLGEYAVAGGRIHEGITYHERALKVAQGSGNRQGVAIALSNMGSAYDKLGEHQRAFDLLTRALEAAKETDSPQLEATALSCLASASENLGDHMNAVQYGERALKTFQVIGSLTGIGNVASVLRKAYKNLGHYDKALSMYELEVQLKDSVMNEEVQRGVLRQEYAFENEKRALTDSLLFAGEKTMHLQVVQKQKYVGALLVCIAGLLLWLLLASRRNTRVVQAKNDEITRTQHQLVTATKLREAEEVRTQIARDIHDELGGDLTKVALLSAEIARRMERTPEEVPALLQSLGRVSREANAALKDIVWSVDPQQDTWQGLVNHAEVYSNRILEGSNMRSELQFEFKGPDAPLDPASKQNIFLVLKEALNNAVKHAHATLVQVRLSTSPSGYELAVLDNGTGFVVGDEGSESHGLRNMRARAEALQAALSLNSSAQGTHLELKGAISI